MISGINSSVSALRSLTKKAESTANNVANVNTPGYKATRVTLQDSGSQSISTASGSDQVGTGVAGDEVQKAVVVDVREQLADLAEHLDVRRRHRARGDDPPGDVANDRRTHGPKPQAPHPALAGRGRRASTPP